MAFNFFFFKLWEWFVDHGIPLIALVLVAILIPRIGRLAVRIVAHRGHGSAEQKKARLALVGAMVYVLQAVAYFIVVMLALTNLGVPAMGAALPATVVSAAVGFGAQKVIQDFLAGFFIISERQFGVGDYVSFDGTSGDIEGTVVALTLRATKIRTPSGEVVTIPNGSAGVITNFSQDWSRAVVDLAIPLQSGESMDDLLERVKHTASDAIEDPAISSDVTGAVEVLPATKLIAPTAAGQSWQVNFRSMVVVNPARQWAVERVIRSALLNVFWDRYDLPADSPSSFDATTDSSPSDPAEAAEKSAGVKEVTGGGSGNGSAAEAHEGAISSKDDGPGSPSDLTVPFDATDPKKPSAGTVAAAGIAGAGAGAAIGAGAGANATARTEKAAGPSASSAAANSSDFDAGPAMPSKTAGDSSAKTGGSGDEDEDDWLDGIWRADTYDSRVKNALSFGGKIRPSTTGLILGLLVTGGLALASSNPEGASAGILSPDHWRDRKPAATEKAEPGMASTTEQPTSQQTPQPETPTDTTGGQEPQQDQRPQQQQRPATTEDRQPNPAPSSAQQEPQEAGATGQEETGGAEGGQQGR